MLVLKIIALIASLALFVYGAQKIKTEIGIWGFLATVASLVWLFLE